MLQYTQAKNTTYLSFLLGESYYFIIL